ncbi:methyltransferase domain-containing protein [Nocardioides euryhalodurans]|uniref:Methyltransferase domain-containing protein n=1 Tax=Nocardioides euryhalodurans TaxID=2518370 RepID=A0A4P7GKT3_9ACTN|nr:methyltransferase domain-containing protein [Nocardioides euryhalodurans]QBR92698.1 methyltransferase domain-containing protein [Nocardioides euryhalodurans]
MATRTDVYSHGHDASVLRAHGARTIANSAAYLEPDLQPGVSVLDVGCGVGSITAEITDRVHPGRVVGVDVVWEAVRATREASADVRVALASGYRLPFADGSFDVVHAHQVLQHLSDPVAALQELRRVCRPGGVVAVRDADYAAMTWWPDAAGLDDWLRVYRAVAHGNDAEPDAGRRLRAWCRAAGFTDLACSASIWSFASPEERRWWGHQWAERSQHSAFARQALERGLAAEEDLGRIAEAWREWAEDEDGWFLVPHAEVRCRA